MKPRTKRQVEVFELSKKLLPITDYQKVYVFDKSIQPEAYSSSIKYWCGKCGQTHERKLDKKKYIKCDSCGVKLKVVKSMKRRDNSFFYFGKAEIVSGYQVIRIFHARIYFEKGSPYEMNEWEVLQHWLLPGKGRLVEDRYREVVARFTVGYSGWSGDLEIRKKNTTGWYRQRIDITPEVYTADSTFKPEYLKYGINKDLEYFSFLSACERVEFCSEFETLLKLKQYRLLNTLEKKGVLRKFWPSVKIAIKNKYKIKNPSDWIDYLEDLNFLRKDLRSPKWICPDNLHKAHKWSQKKKREFLRKSELERQIREMQIAQPDFSKHIKPFVDFVIRDKDLEIRPLLSIEEFKIEGEKLNHCVFTNKYYNKNRSLILSARINGEPIETIEIYLETLQIAQSRGLNNKPTKYHDRIIELIEQNKHLIKKKTLKQQAA